MSKIQIQKKLAKAEARLYDSGTPEAECSDLSMQVSILRQQFARAARIGLWTATAALESAEAEDEA